MHHVSICCRWGNASHQHRSSLNTLLIYTYILFLFSIHTCNVWDGPVCANGKVAICVTRTKCASSLVSGSNKPGWQDIVNALTGCNKQTDLQPDTEMTVKWEYIEALHDVCRISLQSACSSNCIVTLLGLPVIKRTSSPSAKLFLGKRFVLTKSQLIILKDKIACS